MLVRQGPDPIAQGREVCVLAMSAGHQIVLDEDADEIKVVHPGGAELTMSASEIVTELVAS